MNARTTSPTAVARHARIARGEPLQRVAALVAAALVVLCFAVFGATGRAVVAAFFVCVLVALSVIDLRERRLPNVIVLPCTLVVLTAQIALEPERTLEWILAGLLAALFLVVPTLFSPAAMGMGDVKLALLLGAALGRSVALALLVASVASLLPAVVLLARGGAAARKSVIPFGPFLAFGSIVALFVGSRIQLL